MRIFRVLSALCLTSLCTTLLSVNARAQYNPALDQPPTITAAQFFTTAATMECQVLRQNNPGIPYCGTDTLVRNSSLLAWGLSQPGPNLNTVTRYNPTNLTSVLSAYGPTALFFVFAHEAGHHFDLQFLGANVPWGNIVYPPMPGVPLVFSISWTHELRADAWGGCAVKRTHNSIAPVAALQLITAHIENNPDVPPLQYVQLAIQAGYNAC